MTKKKALCQTLSNDDKTDWLIPDFLNLAVVDDEDFDKPTQVRDLSGYDAKIALGISIDYIKRQSKLLKKIKNSIVL